MSNKISLTLYNISMGERIMNTGIEIENIRNINDFVLDELTHGYTISPITFGDINEKISLKLFIKGGENSPIAQDSFLREVSADLPLLENKRASFILFIFHNGDRYVEERNGVKTDKKLYVICGGKGWSDISGYLNHQFGYDIISRVLPIEAKDKELIRYLENKNIIGNVDYQSRSFRKLYSIGYDNSYWSIYTDMVLAFDEEYLEKIGIVELSTVNKNNNVGVAITSGLHIKKNIDFIQLQEIIKKVSLLYFDNPNFSFNKLEIIKTKEEKKNLKVISTEKIKDGLFLNKDYDLFSIGILDTNSYTDNLKITYGRLDYSIDSIYESFSKNILVKVVEIYGENRSSISDIENFLINLKLKGDFKHYGSISRLIELEFEESVNTFFHFLGNFYKVRKVLKDRINEDFKLMYEDNNIFIDTLPLIDEQWQLGEKEDFYNEKYTSKENYYIFDKICPEGVEFCDVLHVSTDNIVSIFHMKDGFGQSIRDLVYQVENSTSLIHDQLLSHDGEGYFKKLYDFKIKKSIEDNFNSRFDTLEKFLELFTRLDKINIYLGIRYTAHSGNYLENKSLVPKVAILDLQKKINTQYSVSNFKILKL